MGILVSAGKWANVLSTARAVTVSPAADALYPASALYDGVPGKEGAWAATAANDYVKADLDIATNGDMEGTFPGSGWSNASTGTGATAQSNTYAKAGTYSGRVTGGASGEGIYRFTKVLRTGFRYRLSVWGRRTTSATGKVRVYNAETRRYLQTSGGTWSSGSADVATSSVSSFTEMTVNFTVEGFYVCGSRDTVTIQIDLANSANEFYYFDEFRLWPEIDFISVHGHNADALMAPQFRSSTDDFSASDVLEATMTVRRPAFYSKLGSAITKRYVMLKFTTVNSRGPIRIGELFCGQYLAASEKTSASFGTMAVTVENRQAVNGYQAFPFQSDPIVTIDVPLKAFAATGFAEIRDEIVARSEGSRYPLVLVYDTIDDADLVVMGRLASVFGYSRRLKEIREMTLRVESLPFATVVA